MRFVSALLIASLLATFGCGRSSSSAGGSAPIGQFHHEPPHGGTAVALGDGDYNLELVRDAGAGTLSAYIFDDDMENFVRSPAPSITIMAMANGQTRTLVLAPVANPATGETVGDTSLFQAQADWLRTTPDFSAKLLTIPVHGTTFTDVSFNFPAGYDK
jgi:hypothetical protein